MATIRSGAAAGATAVQPAALSSGLAEKQDTIEDLAAIRSGAAAGATAVQPAAIENMVTTDVYQVISASKKFASGVTVGDSGSNQADISIGSGRITQYPRDSLGQIALIPYDLGGSVHSIDAVWYPTASKGEFTADNSWNLGNDAEPWGNLYLSGNISDGTNSVAVSNIAKASDLAGKQDAIGDLETIRSGAAAGATAVQPATLNDYVTSSELTSDLALKQDVISDLATIRSGAAAGATAIQPADLSTVATSGEYKDTLNNPGGWIEQVTTEGHTTSGMAHDAALDEMTGGYTYATSDSGDVDAFSAWVSGLSTEEAVSVTLSLSADGETYSDYSATAIAMGDGATLVSSEEVPSIGEGAYFLPLEGNLVFVCMSQLTNAVYVKVAWQGGTSSVVHKIDVQFMPSLSQLDNDIGFITSGDVFDCIRYSEQWLEESQQMQARKNIGLPYTLSSQQEVSVQEDCDISLDNGMQTVVLPDSLFSSGFNLDSDGVQMIFGNDTSVSGAGTSVTFHGTLGLIQTGEWTLNIEYVEGDLGNELSSYQYFESSAVSVTIAYDSESGKYLMTYPVIGNSVVPGGELTSMVFYFAWQASSQETGNLLPSSYIDFGGLDIQSLQAGAALGATAVQPSDLSSALSAYVTSSSLTSTLESYATTSALTSGLSRKQNTISDLSTIRSNAAFGASLACDKSYQSGGTNRYVLQCSIDENGNKTYEWTTA